MLVANKVSSKSRHWALQKQIGRRVIIDLAILIVLSLLFCSSSQKHDFTTAESFSLICCCFSKTRQFSAINQTKFGQIIVKCKMRRQHDFFFFFLLFYSWSQTCVTLSPKKAIHCDVLFTIESMEILLS